MLHFLRDKITKTNDVRCDGEFGERVLKGWLFCRKRPTCLRKKEKKEQASRSLQQVNEEPHGGGDLLLLLLSSLSTSLAEFFKVPDKLDNTDNFHKLEKKKNEVVGLGHIQWTTGELWTALVVVLYGKKRR